MSAPIYRLPPYRVDSMLSAEELGQVVDWGQLATGVPDAHRVTRGKGINVAVLDTGVQAEHPDLSGQFTAIKDFSGSMFGPADRVGHGTHCAGIVAANDNTQGVIGVAPHARLLIGKVLGDDGSGSGQAIAKGIDWAVEMGADVISMSLGSPQPDPVIRNAINRAVAAGRFVVCAAGNSGPINTQPDYPAAFENVLSVASIQHDGTLSDFSSRGKVDFAAPGSSILSTYPRDRYARLSGTSMACPFVAGVVALLLSKHKAGGLAPIKTLPELISVLRGFASDPVAGQDPGFGWGVIRVDKLLEQPAVTPPTPQTPALVGSVDILHNGERWRFQLADKAPVKVA